MLRLVSVEKGYKIGKNWPRKKLWWSTYAFMVVICYPYCCYYTTLCMYTPTPHHDPTGQHPLVMPGFIWSLGR